EQWVSDNWPKLEVEVVKRSASTKGFAVLPRRWIVERTFGWLMRHRRLEANEELEKITANLRSHPDVLEVRWKIYAKAGQWAGNVDIGKALTQLAPERAGSWIKYAFALHEMKRTEEAWNALLPVASNFPREPTIPYILACYAA